MLKIQPRPQGLYFNAQNLAEWDLATCTIKG